MKLHHGDTIEFMRQMPAESVDLVLTDPPYLMDYSSNFRQVNKFEGGRSIANDLPTDTQLIVDYFEQCHRILKNDTHIYSFCSWHKLDFFKIEFEKHFTLKNILIWNKRGGGIGDLKGSYMSTNEFILFGHKGRRELLGKRGPSVLEFDKVPASKMIHQTEKPVPLLSYLVNKSSNPGDIVFDGFMGSGTTGLAAQQNGRDFIGCEIDDIHFNSANERLNGGLNAFF